MRRLFRSFDRFLLAAVLPFAVAHVPDILHAQAAGTVTGVVVREGTDEPISGVTVQVAGTALSAVTGPDGRFTLHRVPTGQQTLVLRRFGHRPAEQPVTVQADATADVQIGLAFEPVTLGEVVVSGASRTPERIVEAPAAITVVDPVRARDMAVTGQAPLALTTIPGVDVVQSGMNDFNVNARGFNSSLNRRVLVLQDGRDLAVPFLGSQEWAGFSMALDEVDRIEMVRGPGSALYGANAFSGVLNVITRRRATFAAPSSRSRAASSRVSGWMAATPACSAKAASAIASRAATAGATRGRARAPCWTVPPSGRSTTTRPTRSRRSASSWFP